MTLCSNEGDVVLSFAKGVVKLNTKSNPKHSPVAIKKVVKTVEGLGFTVTGIKADPDGSFFVETAKGVNDASLGDYWDDKVLPK